MRARISRKSLIAAGIVAGAIALTLLIALWPQAQPKTRAVVRNLYPAQARLARQLQQREHALALYDWKITRSGAQDGYLQGDFALRISGYLDRIRKLLVSKPGSFKQLLSVEQLTFLACNDLRTSTAAERAEQQPFMQQNRRLEEGVSKLQRELLRDPSKQRAAAYRRAENAYIRFSSDWQQTVNALRIEGSLRICQPFINGPVEQASSAPASLAQADLQMMRAPVEPASPAHPASDHAAAASGPQR